VNAHRNLDKSPQFEPLQRFYSFIQHLNLMLVQEGHRPSRSPRFPWVATVAHLSMVAIAFGPNLQLGGAIGSNSRFTSGSFIFSRN
jgi:hypothetical protein